MIIRAAQSSDDDSDGAAPLAPPPSLSDAGTSGLSASSAVKLAWLGASLALVALLLLDLAALLNQFLPASEPASDAPDPFTVVSWALLLWRRQSVGTVQSATVLNNLVGQIFVAAWIFSRETALAAQRQRSSTRTRSGSLAVPACISRRLPWVLVAAVMCVGHVASCAYILFALFESHGAGGARGSGSARTKFWLGRSSLGSRTAPRV